ncbi:MAG: hypothetical protein GY828_02235 [Candidatus Gracilibacteria bacterium]|nr:hypothetical protein [Candidatus Gracilibacteria bacterium]
MDNITKFLLRLSQKERNIVLEIIKKILSGDHNGLDIKKLQGKKYLYRVRKGKIRIIYSNENGNYNIHDINFRNSIYN